MNFSLPGRRWDTIKDKIIIEGSEVILLAEDGPEQVRVARRVPVDSLLRYVARVMPPPLPVLPPGTRWLRQRKDLLLLAVEHPPQCRTLKVSGGKKGKTGKKLRDAATSSSVGAE